jgi:hypothetical protein
MSISSSLDSKKKVVPPSTSVSEILGKQKRNLLNVVHECSRNEEKRSVKMERATTKSQQEKLEARFAMEREHDQHRLKMLKDDFDRLKKTVVDGDFNERKVQNRYRKLMWEAKMPSTITTDVNRFQGLETPGDFILHKACVNMFEKYDSKFRDKMERSRQAQINDAQGQLNLLYQKRDVLLQLAEVQKRSDTSHTVNTSSGRFNKEFHSLKSRYGCYPSSNNNNALSTSRSTGRGRPNSARSTTSTSSAASWASFRGNGNHFGDLKSRAQSSRASSNRGAGGGIKPRVPPLKLPTIG